MFDRVKSLFSMKAAGNGQFEQKLDQLKKKAPVPVFWLFGRTQSGKTSIIRYLTGADEAEVGNGFVPCTRFSRLYQFPTPDAPLLTFLDTRGMDEPGYDPGEDLAKFNHQAHIVLVTVKVLDHARENVVRHLRTIRRAQSHRPVVLVLTCLHEANPQEQHLQPYPYGQDATSVLGALTQPGSPGEEDLRRSIAEQCKQFEGLFDAVVPIDLTKPEEGYADVVYGGEQLKKVLLEMLPKAYRQTLVTLDQATHELTDLYAQRALPHIAGYSTLAATAGAIPVPWLDLLILPGIQTRMIYHLAHLYGQPLDGTRFLELASTLGLGMVVRQAFREAIKFIPYVGSVVGGAMAGASTYALGKAFCYYYSAVHHGHVPRAEELKHYYEEQLALAQKQWTRMKH